jgi:hypothetical protein
MGCALLPPSGLPHLQPEVILPPDLVTFYASASGAVIFSEAEYPYFIVGPDRFAPANPIIVGEPCSDDISAWWYTLAHDGNGDYLTIDLHPDRIGRCYDSFHETHGLVGQIPVIARSFQDLLLRLIKNSGSYPYWLEPGFPLGDAYDGVNAVSGRTPG